MVSGMVNPNLTLKEPELGQEARAHVGCKPNMGVIGPLPLVVGVHPSTPVSSSSTCLGPGSAPKPIFISNGPKPNTPYIFFWDPIQIIQYFILIQYILF